ncbi:MAG: preprotein translocase subunit SecA [Cytophagales bacterium]
MLEVLSKGLAKVFGTKSEKDIKEIQPYVNKALEEYGKLKTISDDELRLASYQLREFLKKGLSALDEKIQSLKTEASEPGVNLQKKNNLLDEVEKIEKERDKELEKLLLEILPKAFAIVRETARRFKENGKLVVKATERDIELSKTKSNVEIQGNHAVWHNKWKVLGNEITWDMVHYEVQLIGGVALHMGKIAEMATGEGKTLVSTLPSFLNALSGLGVHLVTVNDYLAKRDSEWNAPLFEFHGLTVDCIDKHQPNTDSRRNAYLADITYGTNNEFGFDYLRDNMAKNTQELVQRKHHFAIIDEVDSVLIDDARTPLIISGPVSRQSNEQLFYDLKPRVMRLVEEQKKLVQSYLVEAKKKLEQNPKDEEGGLALFRAQRGLPTYKPLIKYLSETGMKSVLQKTENFYLQDNQKEMPKADAPLYFTIDEKHNSVELTDKGFALLTGQSEDPNFFILPDISTATSAIEKNNTISAEEKVKRTEKLIEEYTAKSERIHTISQLLKAYTLYEKEVDYIVVDNKVKIVDEQTGRVLDGRRYSDGLHQALEAKENVKVEEASQTYATITLQNYFRMYHKLSGMTGTAETESGEFWEIYKLDVVVIPTNLPTKRQDFQDKIYKTAREKFNAVVDEVVELTKAGRPVLVGTTSVEISELLSRMLKMRNIKHQVLNAKYHQKEAEIVAEAGKPGTVTIATNMAGRGTDIKLSAESKAAGGLAIIGTERHESRRVDRQLRGRAGRQGDPGSSQFFVSLEDNLMRLFMSDGTIKIMDRLGLKDGEVIQHSLITKSIENAQKKVEQNNFSMRKRLLEYDDVMNSQRNVVYRKRRNALYGDRLSIDIANMFYAITENVVKATHSNNVSYEDFLIEIIKYFGYHTKISQTTFESVKKDELTKLLFKEVRENYKNKSKEFASLSIDIFKRIQMQVGVLKGNEVLNVPFTDGKKQLIIGYLIAESLQNEGANFMSNLEKYTTLAMIDNEWREHLREMDDLKQSVQNAVYEQKDPLLIYKMEAFKLFEQFKFKMEEDIVTFLMKCDSPASDHVNVSQQQEAQRQARPAQSQNRTSTNRTTETLTPRAPISSQKIVGRNDKVTVQYVDGTIKKDVKFKSIEDDLKNSRCVIVDFA